MTEQQTEHKKKRDRSPGYPSINLEKAIGKASTLYREEGKHAAPVEAILKHWGTPPKSSSGLVALATLKKFGLLVDEGSGKDRKARISDEAFHIIIDDRPNSTERLRLIQKAALLPTIHKELWDRYGGTFPSDDTLKVQLRNKAFTEKAAIDCIQEFHETIAYAKLTKSDKMSPMAEGQLQPEGELIMTPPPAMTQDAPVKDKESEQKSSAAQGMPPTMRTLQIPLTDAPWAMIQVPYPMTAKDWEELMAWFKANASPLTKGAAKPTKAEVPQQT